MRLIIFSIAVIFLTWGCKSVPTIESNTTPKLVWADEFNEDGTVDANKWSYDIGDACELPCGCGWGNNELQYYTDRSKNSRVENGHLVVELHQEKMHKSDYTSARLVSKNKGDWKYGTFEIRAKVPRGLGVWSAIWMLPTENTYGGWPSSGEIDIMENVGYDPDTIVGSAHTLSYHHSVGTHKNGTIHMKDLADDFHIYTLNWDKDQYTLSVDGKTYFTFENEETDYKAWPFDQRFHLILNIAYGGNWGGSKGIDPTSLPAQMLIDYVRVYQ